MVKLLGEKIFATSHLNFCLSKPMIMDSAAVDELTGLLSSRLLRLLCRLSWLCLLLIIVLSILGIILGIICCPCCCILLLRFIGICTKLLWRLLWWLLRKLLIITSTPTLLSSSTLGKTRLHILPENSEHSILGLAGLQIRVCIGNLFSLFLIQNICCEYSKEPSQ